MPGARCARSLACELNKAHERSHHGHTGNHPAFPAQWFHGLLRALPGDQALLPPSPALLLADLTPTLGRQNHTTSPSASARFVKRTARVHRIPPRVDDVAQRPSLGTGPNRYSADLLPPSSENSENRKSVGVGWIAFAQLLRPPCGSSTNTTGVPFLIFLPSKLASQFVSRMQPWDSALLTLEGLGVPWMPYPSADSAIQYDPTGLFGPGLIVNGVLDFTPLNL